MLKKIIFLSLLIVGLALLLPSISHACSGVTICGINYNCGASDGVCPEDIQGCGSCSVCDPDCHNCESQGGGGGGGGGRIESYTCRTDLDVYSVGDINAGEVFSTIEDRYCTDLHFYNLLANSSLKDVKITITLVHPKTLPPEGNVYNYYNVIISNAKEKDISNISFRYRVPISWEDSHGINKNKVVLYRQTGIFWERLPSNMIGKDNEYYYYGSNSTGFSNFAIVGQGVTIWEVLENVNAYYAGEIKFLDVVSFIDKYYTAIQ